MEIETTAAGPEHLQGLLALFEATDSPCYCRFFHFQGPVNEWLERCASRKEENRQELEAALLSRSDDARGVVALSRPDGPERAAQLVGWMKVAPAAVMQKAYERRLYKGLPCFAGPREGVFLIGCALVHPGFRRRGVATALVAGAVRLAPAWGARALEALPRQPKEPVSDEELWTGPIGAFARSGFVEVYEFDPYPVLRREL
jgi:GNAT superfamily N-acetyltransferase